MIKQFMFQMVNVIPHVLMISQILGWDKKNIGADHNNVTPLVTYNVGENLWEGING